MPIARIYPCRLGGTTLTRRLQLEASADLKGATIACQLVEAKLCNQAYFLRSLAKTREQSNMFYEEYKYLLDSARSLAIPNLELKELRKKIFSIEGACATKYFSCLKKILPFEKRSHHGEDPVNSLFNYGYGILYSEVERACILAGLDPYLGFLHTDRYNKPSMVLDIIEEFRAPIVDRAVTTLYTHKKIRDEDFEILNSEFQLSKKGRKKIIFEVMERLSSNITYKGKKMSFKDIILQQCRGIVAYLTENKKFEPFIYKW
jgi:CRISPR-associated protein Cas1